MTLQIRKAERKGKHARIALIGPSGSGKSYTALQLAAGLTRNGKILAIDTEHGSLDKYADILPDGKSFDVIALSMFSPENYIEAIELAQKSGYDTIIIDSLSHAWMGKGGALEMVDRVARRSQSNNNYTAWREVTPLHNQLVEAMIQANAHIIACMRAKTEYVIEKDPDTGKTKVRKIGLAPVQRDGLEYEMDIVADMDMENYMLVSKSRLPFMSGAVVVKPTQTLGVQLREWYDGAAASLPIPTVSIAEPLQRIAGLMNRKGVKLQQLLDAGFPNPREADSDKRDEIISWLEVYGESTDASE